MQSLEISQFQPKPEIKLMDEQKGVMLDTKKTNLLFDGTEVELFIKHIKKVALLQKPGGQDVEDAIPRSIQKAQETKGIRTRIEYHKFIGEFKEIMDYFTRMDYNNLNLDSGNPLGKALSIELEKEAIIELRDNLKEYLEACLIVVEFDEGGEAKSSKENSKKSVKVEDPATTEQLEEKIVKVHMDKDEAQNNLGFGIRKSQKIKERNPAPSNLPTTSKARGAEATSLDKVKTMKVQVPGSKEEANKLDNGLQDLLLEEQALENGLNSVKFTGLVESAKEDNNQDDGLTYTCPVGMVDMTVNKN
ncbi:hypothetical protein KEM48_010217 [Puccinia striiformis f. sp. tritici PST-130]|nr:hypothetical protein KEM48_010217 [Puccinia striiformis f. sp. tritici PST-130]